MSTPDVTTTTVNAPETSRIAAVFAQAMDEGRTALMPFVTVGYPTLDTSIATVRALVDAGADFIELGVPFSDPIADGATVQRTSQKALENGTRMRDVLHLVRTLRADGITTPFMLMGYFNSFLRHGLEKLVADATEAGADGFIIPDLPPEESADLHALCQQYGRDLIFLLAPTSTERRIRDVAERGSGFIYCVSVRGVTGARDSMAADLGDYLDRIRAQTDLPLAVGFGISSPKHVREVGAVADGAIVASAMINYADQFPAEGYAAASATFLRYIRGVADLDTVAT